MDGRTYVLRIFAYVVSAFTIITIFFGAFILYNTSNTMKTHLGNKCLGIASAVAVLIEEDPVSFRNFSEAPDTFSQYYRDIEKKLRQIGEANEGSISYIYVEVRASENDMMYVFDAEAEESLFFSPPGERDDMTSYERQAYETQAPVAADRFTTNQYGTLLTCYYPFFDNRDGSFLGLVGVDVSIDQYNAIMKNQTAIVVVSSILMLVLVFGGLFLSSGFVEKLVVRDSLTGFYTKSFFLRSLRKQMRRAQMRNIPLYVLMADLDHFKVVNDTYGHPFGDVVLSTVSKAIASTLRKTDCIARYGGEEFSAYLIGISSEKVREIVERIREKMHEIIIYNKETNSDVRITISIGLTRAYSGQTEADVLSNADKALYLAKRSRDTVVFYPNDHEGTEIFHDKIPPEHSDR